MGDGIKYRLANIPREVTKRNYYNPRRVFSSLHGRDGGWKKFSLWVVIFLAFIDFEAEVFVSMLDVMKFLSGKL